MRRRGAAWFSYAGRDRQRRNGAVAEIDEGAPDVSRQVEPARSPQAAGARPSRARREPRRVGLGVRAQLDRARAKRLRAGGHSEDQDPAGRIAGKGDADAGSQ